VAWQARVVADSLLEFIAWFPPLRNKKFDHEYRKTDQNDRISPCDHRLDLFRLNLIHKRLPPIEFRTNCVMSHHLRIALLASTTPLSSILVHGISFHPCAWRLLRIRSISLHLNFA